MRSAKILLAALNKSVYEEDGKLHLNRDRFNANIPDKAEQDAIRKWIESKPPQIMPYHDRFCRIEYVQTSPKSRLAIVVDKDGKALLIIHRDKSKPIWECDA